MKTSGYTMELSQEPGCKVSIKVTISPLETNKAYKKAIKRINNQISLPGFRKGKAPDDVIIQRHKANVDQEWREILVQKAFEAALEETKIYPLNKEAIQRPKIEEYSTENGAIIHFAYERYPEVPDIDFSQIHLPKIEKEPISEQRVIEIVDEIRTSLADWEDITDKAAEPADYVELTIESLEETPPKPIVKNRRFKLDDKNLASWVRHAVVGLQAGGQVETMTELDENASESVRAQYKPTKVLVTLHGIKKMLLRDVDDALAQRVGAESVDDLLKKIRLNLESEARQVQREKQIVALEDSLLRQYPIDLPTSLIASQKESIYKQKKAEIETLNLSEDEKVKREKGLEENITKLAEDVLRLYFLNKKIAEQGHITVSKQELNDELVKEMSRNPRYFGKKLDKDVAQNLISELTTNLMRKKTHDYALAHVLSKAS